MKHHIKLFALLSLTLLFSVACSNIDYNGEYSKDGYYTGENQISLDYQRPADTLQHYTFSDKRSDTIAHVVHIPVILTGKLMNKPQTYQVMVDPSSTAKEGIHYIGLKSQYAIPANKERAWFTVTLLRKNLSETKDDSIRLVLKLVPTADLGLRFSNKTKVTIAFDNRFVRPDYWDVLELWGMGQYHVAKHKKLLDTFDWNVQGIYDGVSGKSNEAMMNLYYNIQKVLTYFKEHPNELK